MTTRLRRRLETESQQIEKTAASELRRLGESLSAVVSDALRTIKADTATAAGRMHGMLLRTWLLPMVVGLSLSLGICGGSWAAMHWLWTSIEARIEVLAALDVDIRNAREMLVEIEETTWGVTLREIDGERYVVLPVGALDYPPWTVGGQPAVRLSRK